MIQNNQQELKRSIIYLVRYMDWMTYEGLRECEPVSPEKALRPALRELIAEGKLVAAEANPAGLGWPESSKPITVYLIAARQAVRP